MNDELLAELRRLRQTAEDQERRMHWQAISGHFTRFVILLCASQISPYQAEPLLRMLAVAAGVLWLAMTFIHLCALMPERMPESPRPPARPSPPPVP
jgi:hypothetical protein